MIGGAGLETPVTCVVRDISKYGAQIEATSELSGPLPDCFTLVFYNNRIRSEASCVVRWRSQGRMGVCFAGPVKTSVDRRTAG